MAKKWFFDYVHEACGVQEACLSAIIWDDELKGLTTDYDAVVLRITRKED